MSQSSSPNLTGRGGANTNESNNSQTINILISTTTGTQFDISVESLNTIEHLKKVISKKLKVNKDKISLLFKERFVHLIIKKLIHVYAHELCVCRYASHIRHVFYIEYIQKKIIKTHFDVFIL